MTNRIFMLAAASAISLSAGMAYAQPAAAPQAATVEELVVIGSRGEPRSRLDTVAPVDVITAESLQNTGTTSELAQTLANLTPALNFPRPAITDGTDHVRPVTLRGLPPAQTLVLIDGHRAHIGALINVNGSIGRGSTAFDLNSVPSVTLQSVEVLRDGASAQYGSDAIAGVVNLRLRGVRSGGGLTATVGQYDTSFTTARGNHSASDGLTYTIAGWQGLPLGPNGYLTLSGEYVRREPTNRSDFAATSAVNPSLGGVPTQLARFGDPDLKSYSVYANAGLPINETWSLYGYAGYQHRDTLAAATARPYNDARNRPTIYPFGFTPIIGTGIDDFRASGGIRGVLAGWNTDLAIGYGLNRLEYNLQNTINVSLTPVGATSTQTTFFAGQLEYSQWLANLDLNRDFEVGLSDPVNVAFGFEYRNENFQIAPGELNSYVTGPNTGAAGSQGFPGYRPANTTDVSRHNWSAYIDVEGHLTSALQVGVAARYENYSDFGTKATGKFSARYDFTDWFALRGAIQSGFRAPSLQEQFFTYTSTNLTTLPGGGVGLIEAGTFATNNPIAIALGARPLQPETSTNYSIGLVARRGPFQLTVDAYQIDMRNRIVYSENLPNNSSSADIQRSIFGLLAPSNISAARFFLNGVDSTTKGIDVVAHYRLTTSTAGNWDFTLAANFNNTEVTRVPSFTGLPAVTLATATTITVGGVATTYPAGTVFPAIPGSANAAFLFDRGNRLSFEEGTPERKLVGTVEWSAGNWGVTTRITSYDAVRIPNNNPALDYFSGDRNLVDFEGRYAFPHNIGVALGVNNLFDVYPQFTPTTLNGASGSVGFPSFSPFGFNGRFL